MIITCQECNSNFNLDESLLKPTGSKVRCSKCHKVFVAYPQTPPEEPETPAEKLSDIGDVPVTKDVPGPDKLDLSDMDKLFAEEKDTEVEDITDELDLSDIEKFFEEEETPEDEDITDEAIEDLDLDFDLDIEPETDTSTEDTEAKEKPDELDLSDMDKFFAEEKTSEAEGIEDFDLDLNLDLELEADKPTGETAQKVEPDEPDELDLSDIEEILDLEEPEAEEKHVPDDILLELDMETEPELEKVSEGLEPDELEEVDLLDIEKMLEIEPAPDTQEDVQPEDLVLESDLEEEQADFPLPEDSSEIEVFESDETTEPAETEAVTPEFEIEDEDDLIEEEITEIQPALDQAGPSAKKRISKPIFALLIIAILAGGLYGTYVLLDYMKIEIPFVSDYLKPKVSDPAGNLKIETIDVDSKFVPNAKTGKLFVITGRIKNGYSSSRRSIKIKGKLFTKGKTLTKTEIFFCGNVLSDMELSNMELVAIKKRLSNSLGDNKSNTGVKPGQELPFMIVFSDLPDNLEEFAIEVAGSISE